MYPKFFSDRIEIKHNMSIDVRKMHIEKLRRDDLYEEFMLKQIDYDLLLKN